MEDHSGMAISSHRRIHPVGNTIRSADLAEAAAGPKRMHASSCLVWSCVVLIGSLVHAADLLLWRTVGNAALTRALDPLNPKMKKETN